MKITNRLTVNSTEFEREADRKQRAYEAERHMHRVITKQPDVKLRGGKFAK